MSIRMRHTRGHTNNRRSHHALKATNIVKDKESGNLRLPHRLDEKTGMYRGKQIFTAKAKAVKVEKGGKKVEHPKDHVHDSEPAKKEKTSVLEKFSVARPRSRSGMGGGSGGK